MILKKWDDLPEFMKCDEVKVYYDILSRKKGSLVLKRIFDIVVGVILLILLAIPMLIIAVLIKLDSKGPVFYRQERVTRYGKKFRIHKFRTMVNNADQIGSAVTVGGDSRITKVGAKIRDYRLDELPQVFDVLSGDMSFVGTRPEATKYVEKYSNEMLAREQAILYANEFLFAVLGQLPEVAPKQYDRYFQSEWREEQEKTLNDRS